MCHKVTFLSESIILSVRLSYDFQFPYSAFDNIFKTFVGPRTENSEMEWPFCENRFPTDNWVFLSSVNYLEHPPSSVGWLIFGEVSSTLGSRKQIQGCRMPRLLCFWCEKQLLKEMLMTLTDLRFRGSLTWCWILTCKAFVSDVKIDKLRGLPDCQERQ